MTTVVVFGGAGFLGRRLVHRLVTEGMDDRRLMSVWHQSAGSMHASVSFLTLLTARFTA